MRKPKLLCRLGRHRWMPWGLVDETHPVVRLWFCSRCGRVESL